MWSAAELLGFVNLVNREEIPTLITKESVYLVTLSITSVNYCIIPARDKYIQFFDECWRQQIT